MDDLYHQQILELYKNPLNYGELKDAQYVLTETNASCGDSYTFYIKHNADKNIERITFTGTGCAISMAACSLLTEYLPGKSIVAAPRLDHQFMQNLIGAQVSSGRSKCLMLPITALSKLKANISSQERR